MMSLYEKTFLIVGCQRSGTTLLRLMLDSHPDCHVYDELLSYGLLAANPLCDSLEQAKMVSTILSHSMTGFKIPRWTEQLGQQHLYDYGLLNLRGELMGLERNFYDPSIRIIHIVRNAPDTISSMFGWKMSDGTSWWQKWGWPILCTRMLSGYRPPPATLAHMHPDVAAASTYWLYKNQAAYELAAFRRVPVYRITYESLVAGPKSTMLGVLNFLGLPWHDNVLRHHRVKHGERIRSDHFGDGHVLPEGEFTIGGTDMQRPIDMKSMAKWKTSSVLTESELDLISHMCGPLERELYAGDPAEDVIDYQI